jgi:hypothetical protein
METGNWKLETGYLLLDFRRKIHDTGFLILYSGNYISHNKFPLILPLGGVRGA